MIPFLVVAPLATATLLTLLRIAFGAALILFFVVVFCLLRRDSTSGSGNASR